MSVYTHTAIGAAVGAATGNPVLAFLLGAAGHAAADTAAHFDFENVWLEVVLAFAAGVFFWWLGDWRPSVLCGILGGALPDLDNLLVSLGLVPETFKIFPSHGRLLRHGAELGPASAAVQLGVVVLMALWVYTASDILA